MRLLFVVMWLLPAGFLLGGDRINICLLNLARLPESALARAKAETQFVFRSAAVSVSWIDCDQDSARQPGPKFYVRLRNNMPPQTAGASSLETMGVARLSESGKGYLVDAFFPAVQSFAEAYTIDAESLLGYVIAHEIGHLLLGPGHAPGGIMARVWKTKEINALRRRWLKFEGKQREEILLKLRSDGV